MSAPKGKGKDARGFRDGTKPRSYKEDRRQYEPKKGGGGGKGTWGKPGSEINPSPAFIDRRDPNYPEEEDEAGETVFHTLEPELTVDEVRKQVSQLTLEYFENGDTEEVLAGVSKFVIRSNRPEILVVFVNHGLEKHDAEREMISVLLSESVDTILSPDHIYDGFLAVLRLSEDLAIDVPDVAHLLGKFIARAIADKVLHHSFLERDHRVGKQGEEAVRFAQILMERNSGVELDTAWGVGGGLRPVRILSEKIELLVQEYLSSADKAEAERCLAALGVPHFHHELVYTLLVLTAEKKEHEYLLALDLLKYLQGTSVLTVQQLSQGLERLFNDTNDITLDIPGFHAFLERFIGQAVEQGIVSKALAEQVPKKGRKRYLSENDGGAIKS